MSGHTYIFEQIEILVYGSGRHFEFGPKYQISPNGIDGDFFSDVKSHLSEATDQISALYHFVWGYNTFLPYYISTLPIFMVL